MFGLLWAMLNPLMLALVLATVYANILGRDFYTYALYLLCGLFPFNFVSEVSGHACGAFSQSRAFLRELVAPIAVYPTYFYLANALGFLFAFGALLLILLGAGALKPLGVLLALPGLVLLFFFGWGFALIQAVLGGVFRDYEYLSGVVLRMFFFATPILYRTETLDEHGRSWIYEYNPLYYLIHNIRSPLLTGELPEPRMLGIALLCGLATALLGTFLIKRIDRKIVHFL